MRRKGNALELISVSEQFYRHTALALTTQMLTNPTHPTSISSRKAR